LTFAPHTETSKGRMKTLAEADDGLHLPNPEPQEPVECVFVAMEPSLWGPLADQRARIQAPG
jgi:hypothetical protein